MEANTKSANMLCYPDCLANQHSPRAVVGEGRAPASPGRVGECSELVHRVSARGIARAALMPISN